MKKFLLIPLLITLLSSCATFKPVTKSGETVITIGDSATCIEKPISAEINHDSLFYYADKGITFGEKDKSIKIYYQSNGSDPLNGQIVVEVHMCLSGTDFCIDNQFWIQVPRNEFYLKIQNGLTFTAQGVSVFLIYSNGKLTVTPKVCIKTKVTAKALR